MTQRHVAPTPLIGGALLMMAACTLWQPRGAVMPKPARSSPVHHPQRAATTASVAPRAQVAVLDYSHVEEQLGEYAKRLAQREGSRTPRAEAGYYMDVQEAQLRQELHETAATVARGEDVIVLRLPEATVFGPGGMTVLAP